MGDYDFKTDLKRANDTEKEIGQVLIKRGSKVLEYNNDNRYDLKIVNKAGVETLLEIKEDFMVKNTHNIAVEYECRGKPSGIVTTKADYYIYKIWDERDLGFLYSISVDDFKNAIISCLYTKQVIGGDVGSNTKMYLFRVKTFLQLAKHFK